MERIAFLRRELHKIPEIDSNLPKTNRFISSVLSELRCELIYPWESAVCAYFNCGSDSTIAFRSDMDALSIAEKSQIPYKSIHTGAMHACAHDGHMAIMLEFARYISEHRDSFKHNILLIFQPAEETTGGAKPICESGILDRFSVRAIFGLHVWPGLNSGEIFSCRGAMMARSSHIKIDIVGRSAHIAKAHDGADALMAGTQLLYELNKSEMQELSPEVFRLLKFGIFNSGTANNALSAFTHIEGSLRCYEDEVFDFLKSRILEIMKTTDLKYSTASKLFMSEGYPAVMNDKSLYEALCHIPLLKLNPLITPEVSTEDFSVYQKYVPGVFFFLGAGDAPALHSDEFDFDERILNKGVELFIKVAQGLSDKAIQSL